MAALLTRMSAGRVRCSTESNIACTSCSTPHIRLHGACPDSPLSLQGDRPVIGPLRCGRGMIVHGNMGSFGSQRLADGTAQARARRSRSPPCPAIPSPSQSLQVGSAARQCSVGFHDSAHLLRQCRPAARMVPLTLPVRSSPCASESAAACVANWERSCHGILYACSRSLHMRAHGADVRSIPRHLQRRSRIGCSQRSAQNTVGRRAKA